MRIGHGYDSHRLVTGRKLILGGVCIAYEKGLAGHSDADALTHAVIDAIFGALALGDIGKHFPDSDDAYKDANSLLFLKRCVALMTEQGYTLGNLDATIIVQAPKLAPYINEMRTNLAEVFTADVTSVSVKAKTEEGMGFTGRGEGICVHCVCILVPV